MKNVAASVRARLMNHAKANNVPFAAALEHFVVGRLLWRIHQSASARRFVLKGAQLFRIWSGDLHRPTRDLDLLCSGDPSNEAMHALFTELLGLESEPQDGLKWGDVVAMPIREDQRYEGVRIVTRATLAGAVVPAQVDIGFGDVITPAPVQAVWRNVLEFPGTPVLTYPPETVIAEKVEAAVGLGLANSRMKDFYDLQWLCRHKSFDSETLRGAIRATFRCRGTDLPRETPIAFTSAFAEDAAKQTQWCAFLQKNRLTDDPLTSVVTRLSGFLLPVLLPSPDGISMAAGVDWLIDPPPKRWEPGIGWIDMTSH